MQVIRECRGSGSVIPFALNLDPSRFIPRSKHPLTTFLHVGPGYCCRYSNLPLDEGSGIRSLGTRGFLFATFLSVLSVVSTHRPQMGTEVFPRLKRLGREFDHQPPSCAKARTDHSYTFTVPSWHVTGRILHFSHFLLVAEGNVIPQQ